MLYLEVNCNATTLLSGHITEDLEAELSAIQTTVSQSRAVFSFLQVTTQFQSLTGLHC